MSMFAKLTLTALCLSACTASEAGTETANPMSDDDMTRELILLAAPGTDGYYDQAEDAIIDFHIGYAETISAKDDVIVLVGPNLSDRYVAALGEDRVASVPMADIWMRDFAPLNATDPVMMRYSAAGQGGGREGQREADYVQEVLFDLLSQTGAPLKTSDLINDGGNFVDDHDGRAVLSRKFLRDNDLSEADGRAAVKAATGARHVAFIEADEQGGLEHADGVVAFVGPNRLVINSYPEDPAYAAALKADLRAGLPGVILHEIITPYDGSAIYDARFGSACGLYTNMLVTPDRIYFPQFGIPEDRIALEQLSGWTDLEIVPVKSGQVCHMGGGVRCMSAQMRGETAQRMRHWLSSR